MTFIKLTQFNGEQVIVRAEDIYRVELKEQSMNSTERLAGEWNKPREKVTWVRTDPNEEWRAYIVIETVEEVFEQLNPKK